MKRAEGKGMVSDVERRDEGIVRIGVVTPTLNAARYLERTLESIWGRPSSSYEIDHVIVDGGSTDGTLEIASRYPSRAVVAEDDKGMYDAVNRGFAMVSGDIVGYINADDEIAPGGLDLITRAFASRPDAQWLCGRVEYIDEAGRVLGRLMPVRMSLRSYLGIGWSCIPQQTVWARRAFYDMVGPFDTAYRNCGDYDWYARALRRQHPLMLPEVLGRFRLHAGSISHDLEAMDRESRTVRERNGGSSPLDSLRGRVLSLRLNARNPGWFLGKKTGRIDFTP
jgi:glycosyltransferase involved in cell wall biosynthesis